MTFFKTGALALGLAFTVPSISSAATLIGDDFDFLAGGAFFVEPTSGSGTVGAGVEFSINFGQVEGGTQRFIDVDISEDSIDFSWRGSAIDFGDFDDNNMFIALIGLDFGEGIASVEFTEDGGTSAFPFGGNNVLSPTEDGVLLAINGIWDGTASVSAKLTEVDTSKPAVVPLPASAPLLLAGFGGMMVLRRKRKQAA